jgi:hypothetical protein
MARNKKTVESAEADVVQTSEPKPNSQQELAAAIVEAIRSTSPLVRKTQFNKQSKNPWTPKDGSPKPRLKRKAYHHGLLLGDPSEVNNRLLPEEIELFNKLKPGTYCDGFVKVIRRRDKGIDIDYPVRAAAQRLRLVNDFGIRSFKELLQRCVEEAAAPKKTSEEDDD